AGRSAGAHTRCRPAGSRRGRASTPRPAGGSRRPGSTPSASGPGRFDLGPDPLAHGLLEVEERVDERVTRGDHLPAGLGLLLERLTEVLERPGAEPVLLAREPERLPGDLVRALGEPERLPLVAELEVRAPHGLLDLEARLPVG